MGRKGPRDSAGASGFMSQVSTCDAPPDRKNRMVERALPPPARGRTGAAAAGAPKRRPATPTVEATKNVRREREDTPEGSGGGDGVRVPRRASRVYGSA